MKVALLPPKVPKSRISLQRHIKNGVQPSTPILISEVPFTNTDLQGGILV